MRVHVLNKRVYWFYAISLLCVALTDISTIRLARLLSSTTSLTVSLLTYSRVSTIMQPALRIAAIAMHLGDSMMSISFSCRLKFISFLISLAICKWAKNKEEEASTILMKFSHYFRYGQSTHTYTLAQQLQLCGRDSSYTECWLKVQSLKSAPLVRDAENASAKFLMYFRQVCAHTYIYTLIAENSFIWQ